MGEKMGTFMISADSPPLRVGSLPHQPLPPDHSCLPTPPTPDHRPLYPSLPRASA